MTAPRGRERVNQPARWLTENVGAAPFLLAAALALPSPGRGATTIAAIPGLCPTLRWLHIPCPGCGITRSVVATAHGDFATAFSFHPLGPVVFGWIVGAVLVRVPVVRRAMPTVPRRIEDAATAALICGLAAVWIARLLHLMPHP